MRGVDVVRDAESIAGVSVREELSNPDQVINMHAKCT